MSLSSQALYRSRSGSWVSATWDLILSVLFSSLVMMSPCGIEHRQRWSPEKKSVLKILFEVWLQINRINATNNAKFESLFITDFWDYCILMNWHLSRLEITVETGQVMMICHVCQIAYALSEYQLWHRSVSLCLWHYVNVNNRWYGYKVLRNKRKKYCKAVFFICHLFREFCDLCNVENNGC